MKLPARDMTQGERVSAGLAPLRAPAPAGAPGADEPGFGVYVHWPFCERKCPYCDFNSHVRPDGLDEARWLAALRRELAHWAARTGPRRVTSLFFGGGTPSLMAAGTVAAILDAAAGLWEIAPGAEVTIEANPGSADTGRFRGYRAAGVTRLSLGVQSLRDSELAGLGRIHDARTARQAIACARAVFPRVSFDLIYARPGQTVADWREELSEALALADGHLSLYQLTIEPGTPFARRHREGRLVIPDSECAAGLYEVTAEETERAGLPAYEISNHAVPGEECRHNLLYWRYGEYAGAGPGAHGRIVCSGTRRATVTERHPARWLAAVEANGHGTTEDTPLAAAEQADEMLLMGLRLTEGLDCGRLARLTGLAPAAGTLDELVRLGLAAPSGAPGAARIALTARGRLVLDSIAGWLAAGLAPADVSRAGCRTSA